MEKDITILKIIEILKLKINFSIVEIIDYWEADLCAIGLRKGNRLVYISTFNYLENQELNYDFDFEIVDLNNNSRLNIIKVGRNVKEAELIYEIKCFLNV